MSHWLMRAGPATYIPHASRTQALQESGGCIYLSSFPPSGPEGKCPCRKECLHVMLCKAAHLHPQGLKENGPAGGGKTADHVLS